MSPSTKKTQASSVSPRTTCSPSPSTTKTGKTASIKSKTFEKAPSVAKIVHHKDANEDNNCIIVPSNFTGKIIIKTDCKRIISTDGSFAQIGDFYADLNRWEQKKRPKTSRNKNIHYQCKETNNEIQCAAKKVVSFPFGSFKKKEKNIEYISAHSCSLSIQESKSIDVNMKESVGDNDEQGFQDEEVLNVDLKKLVMEKFL